MESKRVASESIILDRKRAIVSSLCKRLSLDPQSFSSESVRTNDIKGLFSNILKLSGHDAPLKNQEVMKWVAFAEVFPVDSEACKGVIKELNEDLTQKSVLLGGLKPSEADIVVFSAVHSFVSGLSVTERQQFPNVLRWMDYIQSKEDLGEVFEKIPVQKIGFEPQASKSNGELQSNLSSKESESSSKVAEKLEADSNSKKSSATKELVAKNKATEEKKKTIETKPLENDGDVSISLLNIQVGIIRKAWKHPSADSLLVEEIDLGDGNVRQIVSGLAKYCCPDDLVNRRVVIIANVKPGKLRDVLSAGLVLCASNQDHTAVEPLLPPQGAKLGERVQFSGHDGKPEDVLNPKKKQLEKITPHLFTDDKGVATFKGIPFMTNAGPCTSSIPNASVK